MPRLSSCSATIDSAITKPIITTNAMPTCTSLMPSTPKRNALTMYRIGLAREIACHGSPSMFTE